MSGYVIATLVLLAHDFRTLLSSSEVVAPLTPPHCSLLFLHGCWNGRTLETVSALRDHRQSQPHVASAHCVHSAGLPDTCVTGGKQVCCLEGVVSMWPLHSEEVSKCCIWIERGSQLRCPVCPDVPEFQAGETLSLKKSCPHVQWTTYRLMNRKTIGSGPHTVYAGGASPSTQPHGCRFQRANAWTWLEEKSTHRAQEGAEPVWDRTNLA